jgi:Ribulose-5-phosphate 4-epimerase and related epimerases and aldolases
MSESHLREEIVRFARSLFERGLTPGSSGNISLRLEDGGWLVTPTNASLGFLDPARLSRLDGEGGCSAATSRPRRSPSHAVYDSRRGVGAIVHLHSTHAVALSMLPEVDPADVLPPLTAYYLMRVGGPALLPYFRPVIRRSPMPSAVWRADMPRCCWPITGRSSPVLRWRRRSSPWRSWRRRRSSISSCAASIPAC